MSAIFNIKDINGVIGFDGSRGLPEFVTSIVIDPETSSGSYTAVGYQEVLPVFMPNSEGLSNRGYTMEIQVFNTASQQYEWWEADKFATTTIDYILPIRTEPVTYSPVITVSGNTLYWTDDIDVVTGGSTSQFRLTKGIINVFGVKY